MTMTSSTRIERDSLGEIRVPAEAYVRRADSARRGEFPISGLKPWRAFIWSMATIKRAAAEVNRDLGLLDAERAGLSSAPRRRSSKENGMISSSWILSRPARAPVTT